MDIWDYLIVFYGLVVSPVSGFYLVKWRHRSGLKSGKDIFLYLLIGFLNMGVTASTMYILQTENFVFLGWALLILFLYTVAYGVHPLTIDVKK